MIWHKYPSPTDNISNARLKSIGAILSPCYPKLCLILLSVFLQRLRGTPAGNRQLYWLNSYKPKLLWNFGGATEIKYDTVTVTVVLTSKITNRNTRLKEYF